MYQLVNAAYFMPEFWQPPTSCLLQPRRDAMVGAGGTGNILFTQPLEDMQTASTATVTVGCSASQREPSLADWCGSPQSCTSTYSRSDMVLSMF